MLGYPVFAFFQASKSTADGRGSMLDNARFLLVRIALRKQHHWHPLNMLKYTSDLGPDGVTRAINELCSDPANDTVDTHVKLEVKQEELDFRKEDKEIIDLTLDSDDEGQSIQPDAGPSSFSSSDTIDTDPSIQTDSSELDLSYICQSESSMTLFELLSSLGRDQLQIIAKEMKLKISILTVSVFPYLLYLCPFRR